MEYVELYIPNTQNNVMKEINDAYNDLSSGNYELCLFKASKAKAEVDAVISVFGVDLEHFKPTGLLKGPLTDKPPIRYAFPISNSILSVYSYTL